MPSPGIVFQNEHFVAADKPALALTVPGRFPDKDLRPVLGLQLQSILKTQVYPVHRLDYGVSGLTLFALSESAHRVANEWFEQRRVKKTYQALTTVSAEPPEVGQTFEWKCRLLRGKKRAYEHPTGKPSLTMATCAKIVGRQILWQLEPRTGRPHQLRYELFKRGFPIVGDVLYGSKEPRADGILLRATQLEFLEPDAQKNWQLPRLIEVPELELNISK